MGKNQLISDWEMEAQRQFQGWDFSYLEGRYHEETPPWSYENMVRDLLHGVDAVLDMGTGGGEKLLEFKDVLPARTIATEGYPPNFPVAQSNLEPHGVQVVFYDCEADPHMPFDDSSLPLIINRHEAYDAGEIARVLSPGGRFLTQQVDGHDMEDLYTHFNYETAYDHINLKHLRQELEQAGLQIEAAHDWTGKARFADVGALVYFLHAVPWEAPDDFSVQRYKQALLALHAQPTLEFTIRRFVLQARK